MALVEESAPERLENVLRRWRRFDRRRIGRRRVSFDRRQNDVLRPIDDDVSRIGRRFRVSERTWSLAPVAGKRGQEQARLKEVNIFGTFQPRVRFFNQETSLKVAALRRSFERYFQESTTFKLLPESF